MQTAIDYKYLNLINLTNFDLWDVRRYKTNEIFQSNYDFIELSKILKQVNNYENLIDEKDYKLCGLSSYGKGLFHREIKKGKEIQAKKLNKISENQFIYSRLGANNGSFGIVKPEFNGYYVSNEFPIFNIVSTVSPEYLEIVFSIDKYWEIISSNLQGAAHKRFKEKELLNLQIPLPTIAEQKAIVNAYQNKIQQAQILEQQAKDIEEEIEKCFLVRLGLEKNKQSSIRKAGLDFIEFSELAKWSIDHLNKRSKGFDISKTTFRSEPIKNLLLFFEGGKTPSKSRKDFWNGDVFWTSPKDFTNKTILDTAIDTISQTALKEAGVKLFPKGTLLSVFRSGILRHSFPTVITEIETTINQDLKAYSLKEELIDKFYYLYFVNVFKEYVLLNASKKSVTVESINTEDFLELPIVLPPLEVQRGIVAQIESLNSKIKDLNYDSENLKQQAEEEFEQAIYS